MIFPIGKLINYVKRYVIPLGVMTGSFMSSKLICPHKKSGTSLFYKKPGRTFQRKKLGFWLSKYKLK